MQKYLLVVVVIAVLACVHADTDEDSNCRTHQRVSGRNSDTPMRWDIRCKDNGDYENIQCTVEERESRKWCTCYNETHAITQASRKTRHCDCPVARNKAVNSNAKCVPVCQSTREYKFVVKQCCDNVCKCVDEITGEEKPNDQTCL